MADEITDFHGLFFFLSNFYNEPIIVDGKHFQTSEHAFQAYKTLDPEWFETIRKAKSAGKAKKLGRKAPLRKDWESIKYSVMLKCLQAKFSKPEMQKMLLSTGEAILIENNTWHDTVWGCCLCQKHGGEGKNMLGQLLMKIRKELREACAEKSI